MNPDQGPYCLQYRLPKNESRLQVMTGGKMVNPLLHRLFLDHDIIFLFLDNIEKINISLSKVLNTFENIMENGAFAPLEHMLHFP